MELEKRNIHMNQLKNRVVSQITLDDDFIVPDVQGDIDQIVTNEGEVELDSIKVNDGRINVKGHLTFRVLYISNKGEVKLEGLNGKLDFDENFLMDGVKNGDNVNVKCGIEDLDIGIINTRKISGRAIVNVECLWEDIYDIETTVEVSDGEGRTDCLKKTIDATEIAVNKKDIFRIKDSMNIMVSKEAIGRMLWDRVRLKSAETKLVNGKIMINGQVSILVLYEAAEEGKPVQWLDGIIPFSGEIEMPGCDESMIPDIEIGISSKSIEVKPDADGENRCIELDMVLDLSIKIYREVAFDFISDVYSMDYELEPVKENVIYNSVLMKNTSKCKVSDIIKIDTSGGNILQICGSDAQVKTDMVEIISKKSIEKNIKDGREGNNREGINIEGVVSVHIMSVTSDDTRPVMVANQLIPFEHLVEAGKITEDVLVFIRPSVEQLQTVMSGSNEIDTRAVVSFDTLVLTNSREEIVTDIKKSPLDTEKISKIPCMTGYRVQKDDTLWKIAKKYYTTVESIKNINEIKGDETDVSEGDMILVVKGGI